MAVPSKKSVKDFLYNRKEDLVSALLWLDGKIAFSFSYLHKKLLTEWKVEKLLLHKDDSAKTNGFYNHSNVMRIKTNYRA